MPSAVLRKTDLPGQPLIVPIGDDGVVSSSYQDAGWTIDNSTTVEAAEAELADTLAKAAQKALQDAAQVVPHFEPDPAPADQDDASTPAPVAPAQPAPSPNALNLDKEN